MNPCIEEYGWNVPQWPAPANVHAVITTRSGGVSLPPYDSMNLAAHVGDDEDSVVENRRHLRHCLQLDCEPLWLTQVHGTRIVDVEQAQQGVEADGSVSTVAGCACVVMTADCLPVLMCDAVGTQVAAVHAGWRGLAAGAIEAAVQRFNCPPDSLLDDAATVDAFHPHAAGKWLADIYHLARLRLARMGVTQVYGGDACTYQEAERYYSFRRDKTTGRMASLIWFD